MPSRNRVPATIQMVYGDDDDLITWYNSLPKGERHRVMKDVLRAGLGLVANVPRQQAEIRAPLRTDQLETMLQELHHEWETRTRQLVDSLPGYVQMYVEQALKGFTLQSEDVEGAPRLTVIEIDERQAKLKKANW